MEKVQCVPIKALKASCVISIDKPYFISYIKAYMRKQLQSALEANRSRQYHLELIQYYTCDRGIMLTILVRG